MVEERQLDVFKKEDRNIVNVNELQQNNVLQPFLDLSKTISAATGCLPTKVKPNLQRLYASYSVINMKIKDGLSSTCATLTKFVLKVDAVMKRGETSANDQKFLMDLGNKLNSDYVHALQKFIDEARDDLVDIHSILLMEASGGQLENLLDKLAALEKELLQRSNDLATKALEKGQNQGQIDSLQYEIDICEQAIQNSTDAKKSMLSEVEKLKIKIPQYEKDVQDHRDYSHEERGSFWIFSWKIRDVHVDNGERIAKENLNRLCGRIKDLENQINNWSTSDFETRKKNAMATLPSVTEKQIVLDEKYADLQKAFKYTEGEFDKTLKEIQDIYRNSGTCDVESIKMVDTLACSIQVASESLVKTYGKIKTHLEMIDIDPDILTESMNDALQLIAIADHCNGTNKIGDVARRLALC